MKALRWLVLALVVALVLYVLVGLSDMNSTFRALIAGLSIEAAAVGLWVLFPRLVRRRSGPAHGIRVLVAAVPAVLGLWIVIDMADWWANPGRGLSAEERRAVRAHCDAMERTGRFEEVNCDAYLRLVDGVVHDTGCPLAEVLDYLVAEPPGPKSPCLVEADRANARR